MYIPQQFREDDLATLQAFIQNHAFGMLITQQDRQPLVSHIPFTFHPQEGNYGTLMGHLALGNQQWQTLDDGQEALVIFQGPHCYISASWYEHPAQSVPTWNYAVVHAYGIARKVSTPELFQHLTELARTFEEGSPQPWGFQPTAEYMQNLARGIVGFALPVARLEGKFKLSQNRSPRDQERVITALRSTPDAEKHAVAAMMQARLQNR